jgi:anthranilate phosphoribosyltransferase
MKDFMAQLMDGKVEESRVVEFLIDLRERGETVDDLIEAAVVMRKHAVKVDINGGDLLDTCGTGGDGLKTVNVSTITALIASSAGIRVAKHGNRCVSSSCGSADILEALGVNINISGEKVASCVKEIGFGFFFAPNFHPAMKFASSARKKIRGRTIFNCLGPLTNPAGADHHLLGVYSKDIVKPMCEALGKLGAKHAIVVHGENGLDEVSLSGATYIAEWENDKYKTYSVKPSDFGLQEVSVERLKCGSKEDAVSAARDILDGKDSEAFEFVALNSAFALKAADDVSNIEDGIKKSRKLLKDGAVKKKLKEIADKTNRL